MMDAHYNEEKISKKTPKKKTYPGLYQTSSVSSFSFLRPRRSPSGLLPSLLLVLSLLSLLRSLLSLILPLQQNFLNLLLFLLPGLISSGALLSLLLLGVEGHSGHEALLQRR
jgi:hypothetical protein